MNAQLIWLGRINVDSVRVDVWEEHSLADCQGLHAYCTQALKKKFLEDEPEFSGIVRYNNTKVELFSNFLKDIL